MVGRSRHAIARGVPDIAVSDCGRRRAGRVGRDLGRTVVEEEFRCPVRLHAHDAGGHVDLEPVGQLHVFTAGHAVGHHRLALVEHEGSQVRDVLDMWMHARIGDHRAAVGVTDQQRARCALVEHRAHRIAVVGERGRRVQHRREVDGAHRDAACVQPLDDRFPTPGAVPRAVYEDDPFDHYRSVDRARPRCDERSGWGRLRP